MSKTRQSHAMRRRTSKPPRRGDLGGLLVFLVGLTGASATRAEAPKAAPSAALAPKAIDPAAEAREKERRAHVAIRVGERRMTVGEVEDRLANMPPFQRATFGASREAIVEAFIQQVLVRDMLLAAGAEARGLAAKSPTVHQLARARSNATLRAVRAAVKPAATVSDDEVRQFYEQNRVRFDAPERLQLWRILTDTQEDAAVVLAAASKELTTNKWNDLAREKSIDKATNMRGGNLGFLAPDGTSNEAGLKADPALVRAAAKDAKDGELVPHAVAEGDHYAVVWRRGTLPASHRSVEDVAPQIRTTLYRERLEKAEKAHIDELRRTQVRDVDPSLLGLIVLPVASAGINLPRLVPSASAGPAR